MLKQTDDSWCRDLKVLQNMTVNFFKDLYTTIGPRNFSPILQQCPSIVTEEMNMSLTAEITMEEVDKAVFQLETLKAPGPDGLNGPVLSTLLEGN